MWVAQSHFLTVDIPLASLCIAASLLALELTETRAALSHPQLLLLGACAGLAAAMKYNGVLVLASALSPMVPCYPGDARRFSAAAGVLLVAAAATFFLVNPFLLIRPVAAAKDFYYELLHARVGHFGHETDNAWFFHATHSLSNGYGAGGLALAIAGLLWLWKTRDVSTTSKIAATAFPLVFYLMMGRSRLAFQRYVLPVLPFLAVYTALGARAAVHSLIVVLRAVPMQRQLAAYGALAIVLTVVLVNLKASLTHDLLLSRTDTRSDLIDVFRDVNLGDAVRLYSGIHTMAPLISARVLRREQFQRGLRPDLADNEASIIVLNSFDHDALLYDVRSRYPEPYYERGTYAFYRAKLSQRYRGYEHLALIQLSPFGIEKDQVPFSPESIYAPYPPDMPFRRRPGPFIEIYCPPKIAEQIHRACARRGYECALGTGADGYYLPRISEKADLRGG
jgi:hypothetical protein